MLNTANFRKFINFILQDIYVGNEKKDVAQYKNVFNKLRRRKNVKLGNSRLFVRLSLFMKSVRGGGGGDFMVHFCLKREERMRVHQ